MPNLLTRGEKSPKIVHGDLTTYEGAILHLLPHREGGFKHTVCPWSSPGCRATCLNYSGRGQTPQVIGGRHWKTQLWHRDKPRFLELLNEDLNNLQKRAYKAGRKACARLDGTSDLGLATLYADAFPSIQFYDYTKSPARYTEWLVTQHDNRWNNRYLTFSRSEEHTDSDIATFLGTGGTVAVVFNVRRHSPLPLQYRGWPVIDGDREDFRFLDPPGRVVGLRAKGRARHDKSGFVVQP